MAILDLKDEKVNVFLSQTTTQPCRMFPLPPIARCGKTQRNKSSSEAFTSVCIRGEEEEQGASSDDETEEYNSQRAG
jgi:hypothetical protein